MKKKLSPKTQKVHSEKNGAKKVFSGIRYDVFQWKQKIFDGREVIFESIRRNDSVVVIPVEGNNVYIVKELQPHWDAPRFGFVAGGIESGEDVDVAAARELNEEAGMTAKNIDRVHVHKFLGIEWFAHTFIATGLTIHGVTNFDGGEQIELIKISIKELVRMVRNKQFHFPPALLEWYLVQNKEKELIDVLKNPKKYRVK